jgi:hypothetical protein
MKKLVIILIAILLITPLILSAENETLSDKASDIKDKVSSTKLGDIGTTAKEKAEGVLDKKLDIPSEIGIPARIIFGIPENIKLQHLIILLSIWFMLFILLITSLHIIFKKTWMRFLSALIIMVLLSITQAIAKITTSLYNFLNLIELFQEKSFLTLLASITLLLIIFFIGRKLIGKIKRNSALLKAEIEGKKVGAGLKVIKQKYKAEKIKIEEK